MHYHRWPYYQCKNFGNCSKADSREVIELPLGAEPVCPAPNCRQVLTPLNGQREAPGPPKPTEPVTAPPPRRGRGLGLLAIVILLIVGLAGSLTWLLLPGRKHLSVEIPYRVISHVGDILDVPINVDPVTIEDLTLTLHGSLPAGLVLDSVDRRLYGTAQTPGSFPIVIEAAAPGFRAASASTTLLIGSNRALPAALTLHVPPQIHGRVGELLDAPLTVEPAGVTNPALSVTGDLPAGVTLDPAAKRLQGIPQSPGSFEVVIKASASGYIATLAATNVTISPAASPTAVGPGDTATAASVNLAGAGVPSPSGLVETFDLVLAGSNTIGGVDAASRKGLARDLVNEFCRKRWPGGVPVQQELKDVGRDEKDRVITCKLPTGELHRILIQPHGSHLATEALQSSDPGARADVGMSSIPLPELQQDFYEFVVGLDAVAVIVNPDNPIVEMTFDDLKNIFGPNPNMTRWDNGNPIRTCGLDTSAGTTDLLRAFTGIDKALEGQKRGRGSPIPYTGIPAGQPGGNGYEDTSKVIEKVATDPYAIGYVGHAANLPASVKVVAIRPALRYSAFTPTVTTIRTMDYCLARELYLYLPHGARPLAGEFIRFCLSEDGQAIVDDDGFVGFRSANLLARPVFGDRAPPALRSAVANCDRIVLSFRFRAGSSDVLDATGSENWRILIDFLRLPDVANRHLVIVGFADSSDTVTASYQTSQARAAAFAAQLARAGVGNPIDKILGFGKDYPLCDDKGDPNSREAQKNRRVDVYLAR